MAIDRRSKGGPANKGSPGGAKTPVEKRKSLPKGGGAMTPKKPAMMAPTAPTPQKKNICPHQKKAPATPAAAAAPTSPQKKPVAAAVPAKKLPAALTKVSDESKGISKKKNRNQRKKDYKVAQGKTAVGGAPGGGAGQATRGHKKNRNQRFQQKLDTAARSPLSCARALKAEQELNQSKGRVFMVRLPDPVLSVDEIKSWSSGVESALFPRSIEPRSFLLVLKNDVKDVKKEIESLLKSVKVGGKKIEIEEKREANKEGDESRSADLIDPYTLYVTNLDPDVTKDDLKGLFPNAKSVLNPRKHNPRVQGGASQATAASKFAFVSFNTADEALAAFKAAFNKVFKGGKGVVLRFRRVSKAEAQAARAQQEKAKVVAAEAKDNKVKKEVVNQDVVAKGAGAGAAAGKKTIKQEKVVKADEEEDDDEEDEDDDEEGAEMEVDEDDDDEDDDDDEEEEDDDDDDDEDDEDDD